MGDVHAAVDDYNSRTHSDVVEGSREMNDVDDHNDAGDDAREG